MNCFIFEEMKASMSKLNSRAGWILLLAMMIFTFFTGCIPKKKIVYFNEGSFAAAPRPSHVLKCQNGDILDIKVYSVNADVVAPFNHFMGKSSEEEVGDGNGYLVSESGMISLPLLGKVHVLGLTLSEVELNITNKLTEYVKDPVVSVKLMNFEVTVLGEVIDPGIVKVSNAQANLIEVLGMAGDITLNGVREDIIVIRLEDGKRQEFHLDITQKGIFDQEGFYLHQNDIVYVPPNASRRQASALNPLRNAVALTLSTVLGSFIFSLMLK